MSTGANCWMFEAAPDQWYYALEGERVVFFEDDEDDGETDWLDTAAIHGPFASQEAMDDRLRLSYANPGGATVSRYEPDTTPNETITELIERATK